MCTVNILDASAFINGFIVKGDLNFTVSDISYEIKDFESELKFNQAIDEGKLIIQNPSEDSKEKLNDIIKESGDNLRLSEPDKNLIALALDLNEKYSDIKVISDDYSIQNVLKILDIPYSSVVTDGINQVYNWIITCAGCKKTFDSNYPYTDCDVCGSKVFKRRIKK